MSQFEYSLPDSPFRQQIVELITSLEQQYGENASDGLYLVVKKRWQVRTYNNDDTKYLSDLAADVTNAKWEFSQCCYPDEITEAVLSALKFGVISLAAPIQKAEAVTLSASVTEHETGPVSISHKPCVALEHKTDFSVSKYRFSSLLSRHPVFVQITYLLIPIAGVSFVQQGITIVLMLLLSVMSVSYYLSGVAVLLRKLGKNDVWYWKILLYLVHWLFFAWTFGVIYLFYR